MLMSSLRKASLAALLGVVACAAQPPPPAAPTPPSPPVAGEQGAAMAAAPPPAAIGAKGAAGEGAVDPSKLRDGAAPPGGVVGGVPEAARARGVSPMPNPDLGPIPVTAADPTWGSPTALVTLVEWGDFQCPFCQRLATTIEQLKQNYGPDKLRVVWKNNPLPFHPHARPAAETAMALFEKGGSSWFWQYHDAVYRKGLTTPEVILDSTQFTGLTPAQVTALVARGTAARKVDEDMELGKQAGVNGTPASFINGVFISGAQPIDKFSAVIDEQLVAAKAALAAGTPPAKLYAKLSIDNKGKAPAPSAATAKAPEPEDTSIWKVPVGTSPIRGKATAPVTLVIFSDFQCPFCVRVHSTVDQLVADYGDQLRVVFKHNPLPFHPHAEPAAELAIEARAQKGDAGFWKAHDLLWSQGGTKLDDQDLEGVATAAGLNAAAVMKAIQTHKHKAIIDADQELADDLNANGTPHFFINGRRLVGAQPIEKFKALIDEQLGVAKAVLAKGTPAAKLYDTLQASGKEPPPPETKKVPVPTKENPAKGPASAKVTVQIFSDFQCPFCKRSNSTIDEVEKAYAGKVRFVWRNLPLPMHKNAELAAEAAMEAFAQKGSEAFWKINALMFENQGNPGGLERPALDQYAGTVGLDMAKFARALDGRTHQAAVEAEAKLAADAGISGTPGFVVNGYFISGAQPFSKFKRIIDRALKEAK